jgi:hypothetical protein
MRKANKLAAYAVLYSPLPDWTLPHRLDISQQTTSLILNDLGMRKKALPPSGFSMRTPNAICMNKRVPFDNPSINSASSTVNGWSIR